MDTISKKPITSNPSAPVPPIVPFGLAPGTWATLEGVLRIVAVLPLIVGAVLYYADTPEREAAYIREAWRTLTSRPKIQEHYKEDGKEKVREVQARNWGARGALEALIAKDQVLNSIDINGADLSDAMLKKGQLGWTGLQGVTLWGADLTNANLTCADLRGATLKFAKLKGATFKNANITGASFSADAAELQRILAEACVEGTDFGVTIEPRVEGLTQPERCSIANPSKPLGKGC